MNTAAVEVFAIVPLRGQVWLKHSNDLNGFHLYWRQSGSKPCNDMSEIPKEVGDLELECVCEDRKVATIEKCSYVNKAICGQAVSSWGPKL